MSIDTLPKRLGAPPQLDPRIMRMDSFQDESKDIPTSLHISSDSLSDQHQPFFLEKGLFDMEMDPFNFELDDLDLTDYDENTAPVANVNAQVVNMSPCTNNVHSGNPQSRALFPSQFYNYDWEMITQKRELSQIAPLPCIFDDQAPKTDVKEQQKRIPFAPRVTANSNRQNVQRPTASKCLTHPVIKEEPVIKSEPLVCRLTISAQPFAPSDASEMSYSPSAAPRKICLQAGCSNRARSHQRCKKHGGARQCTFDGCVKNSQSRGLCIAHGGGSRCRFEGCKRASQSRGLCKSHGGGKFCAVGGCKKKAHLKQLCRMHGGGERCKVAKCLKWAQKKGWCMAHAKEMEH